MKLLKNIPQFNAFSRYKPLIYELVIRDLKVKYRRSFLGYIWSLLNPLLMMIVLTFIFSKMFRIDIENYSIYLICGQTLFAFFSESTNMAMHSVLDNASLLRKVYIPKYIFPISRVFSAFVTMSFSMVAIIIVMAFTGVHFHLVNLMVVIPLFFLFLFCCGMSLILSAIAVYFRDIMHLYSVLLLAWMYATPIFYPLKSMPDEVVAVIKLNPMYHYINFFRELVIYGNIPGPNTWYSCIICSLIVLALGLSVFWKLQKHFYLHI
jgi:ABC-2 type transport system permease protein